MTSVYPTSPPHHRRNASQGSSTGAQGASVAASTAGSGHVVSSTTGSGAGPASRAGFRHTALPAATPAFELTSDPLAALQNGYYTTDANSSSSSSSAREPQSARVPAIAFSQSSPTVSPKTSPVAFSAPAFGGHQQHHHQQQQNGGHHHHQQYQAQHNGRYGPEDSKRPTSPNITSAVHTTSGRQSAFGHRQNSLHQEQKAPPARSPSVQGRETPKRQDSLGRSAVHVAQCFIERMGTRSSPSMLRQPRRMGSKEHDSDGEESLGSGSSGDEAGKGHGRRPQEQRMSLSGMSQRRTPGPHREGSRRESKSGAFSPRPRDSETAAYGDGRKTPAKYRPDSRATTEKASAIRSGSGDPQSQTLWNTPFSPVGECPFGSSQTSTTKHSAISMDGSAQHHGQKYGHPVAAGKDSHTSPLFVPQARRGPINLKTLGGRRRRRRQRRAKRRSHPPTPLLRRVADAVSTVAWHTIHPIHTARVVDSSARSSLYHADQAFRDPTTGQRCWWPAWIHAYIPLLIWLVVSLSSTFIVLIFHTQVFTALDQLSSTLQRLGFGGRMVLGTLIFLTTFPPLPLYSTLIVLCGFSFGLWQGFLISYVAALSGAIVVYLLSKTYLRGWMTGLLAKSGGLKKVVRAIEKRPKLLFLIRLAPYPYNLMNTLLASSPTLTFKTYFTCTALALPKLLVHCGLGTSIKNFAAYHGASTGQEPNVVGGPSGSQHNATSGAVDGSVGSSGATAHPATTAETVKKFAGIIGVALCIGIFLYLFSVARRAVDEELDDEDDLDAEEEDIKSSSEMRQRRRDVALGATGGSNDYDAVGSDDDDDDDDGDEASDAESSSEPDDLSELGGHTAGNSGAVAVQPRSGAGHASVTSSSSIPGSQPATMFTPEASTKEPNGGSVRSTKAAVSSSSYPDDSLPSLYSGDTSLGGLSTSSASDNSLWFPSSSSSDNLGGHGGAASQVAPGAVNLAPQTHEPNAGFSAPHFFADEPESMDDIGGGSDGNGALLANQYGAYSQQPFATVGTGSYDGAEDEKDYQHGTTVATNIALLEEEAERSCATPKPMGAWQ